ncbi:hypothetical protein Tsubulata_051386 [Turnera subulata]|uniref:F-box domain-containing protein n=1 Tax=Turnera subulata TaxID=218843 RepID=A0A9Q0JD21_9ROSI|nr:hypothetical protein Tsubulata_051386 [Turnera subulata]
MADTNDRLKVCASSNIFKGVRNRDLMSELPDHILHLITSKLNLRDAVRTSALSHKWRKLISSYPGNYIKFSGKSMLANYELAEIPCREHREIFVRGVNQFVKLYQHQSGHDQPFIDGCKLSFCLGIDFTEDINRWVRFAITMGAKTLQLFFSCWKDCEIMDDHKAKFVISGDAFECAQSKFTTLSLKGCVLGPNLGNHLRFLARLRLTAIPALWQYDLDGMFSYLVNLHTLEILRTYLPQEFCVGKLLRLKFLYVKWCDGHDITTINFSNLDLIKFICHSRQGIKFNASGAPKLKILTYDVDGAETDIVPCHPNECPGLQYLTVSTSLFWDISRVLTSTAPTRTITYLRLKSRRATNFLSLIEILRYFPCLEKLLVVTCSVEDSEEQRVIKPPVAGCVYEHLRTIEFGRYCSHPRQLEFVVHMLKHATALQEMIIMRKVQKHFGRTCRKCSESGGHWEEDEKLSLRQELQKISHSATEMIIMRKVQKHFGRTCRKCSESGGHWEEDEKLSLRQELQKISHSATVTLQ